MALTGSLADLGIIDLIQFPHTGRRSGELVITSGDCSARLYYDKGALVHAATGDATGIEALVRVVDWREGGFELNTDVAAPTRSIELDLHRAVMQALKLHDELKEAEKRREAEHTGASDDEDEALRATVTQFIAGNEAMLHVSVLSADGHLKAEADGREGEPEEINRIRSVLCDLVRSYPRKGISRVVLQDEHGTVVLSVLSNSDTVIAVADKTTPLGAVSVSVSRLAAALEGRGAAS